MAVNPTYYQAVQEGYAAGGYQEHMRRMGTQLQQDRAHQLRMRELEALALEKALGLMDGDDSGAGTFGSNQFLDAWNQTLQASQGVYNQALAAFGDTHEWMKSASESATRLGDLATTLEGEYQQFRSDYAPMEQAFGEQARTELGARRRLGEQLEGLAVADYEGAAGRAVADVEMQTQIAKQDAARQLASMGIDPTSGRGQMMMARMGQAGATGKALASNLARRGEKERVTALTGEAMQIFDPTQMAQTAMSIRGAGTSMLQTAAGLRGAETQALRGLATTQTDIARGVAGIGTGMAQNIASQQADVGGLIAGLEYEGSKNAANALSNINFGGSTGTGVTYATSPVGATSGSTYTGPSDEWWSTNARGQTI